MPSLKKNRFASAWNFIPCNPGIYLARVKTKLKIENAAVDNLRSEHGLKVKNSYFLENGINFNQKLDNEEERS